MTRAEAGALGGRLTVARHGATQLKAWGQLGGRPRLPTHLDVAAARLERNKKLNERRLAARTIRDLESYFTELQGYIKQEGALVTL